MAIKIEEQNDGKFVEVQISGKIKKADYKQFVPEIDRLVREHGKIRMLLEMSDLRGWDLGAFWEDIKFDVKHFSDIERISLVGEKKWHRRISRFFRPFTRAKIRYFDRSAIDEARQWAAAV
jgi:hypothetical protein